jgi:hypothetical protein
MNTLPDDVRLAQADYCYSPSVFGMNIVCLRAIPILLAIVVPGLLSSCATSDSDPARKIGVALLVHGGMEEYNEVARFDSTLQIFSYDPNSFVYQRVIWNRAAWPMILQAGNAPKELGKYSFENKRIGGVDPAMQLTRAQLAELESNLRAVESELNAEFFVDYVNWIGNIRHLAHPRSIYLPPDGGSAVNYCGGPLDDGRHAPGWENCDPERYNTDGTIERMLRAGVDEIVVIDLTTSGVRFFKSYDVIRLARNVVADYNAANDTHVSIHWLNDPSDLMRRSYPDEPDGWTNTLGAPTHDPGVSLSESPNPVSADPDFALLHAEGLQAQMNPEVAAEKTGIMLINHATRRYNQLFDPKIDDTLILNANIRDALLKNIPGIQKEHIVGAWMGIKEFNPNIEPQAPAFSQLERTRKMRGENLGHAYLYETDETFPADEWGYLYWEALAYLKNSGVEHIVVAFPQITVDSVLNLVELPNQIAKEIGYKSWLKFETLDFETYPEVGHPFADYWGIWVARDCPAIDASEKKTACCFEMGGCADGRPYPPPRLAPANRVRDDLDPSLAWSVSEFGHLGYDSSAGKPDKNQPVQNQYTGTWVTWDPPNADPRIGQFLAKHVIEYVRAAH